MAKTLCDLTHASHSPCCGHAALLCSPEGQPHPPLQCLLTPELSLGAALGLHESDSITVWVLKSLVHRASPTAQTRLLCPECSALPSALLSAPRSLYLKLWHVYLSPCDPPRSSGVPSIAPHPGLALPASLLCGEGPLSRPGSGKGWQTGPSATQGLGIPICEMEEHSSRC